MIRRPLPASQKPCARGSWCAARVVTRDDEDRAIITPAPADRVFCDRDERAVDAALAQLPALTLLLVDALGHPQRGTVKIRVPFGPALPIRVDVDALVRLIVDAVTSWHARIAGAARLTVPDREQARLKALRLGPAIVHDSVPVLRGHLDTVLGLPAERMSRPAPILNVLPGGVLPDAVTTTGAFEWAPLDGVWAGSEFLRLAELAERAAGTDAPRPERLVGVPCRNVNCDAYALVRAPLPRTPDGVVYWSECSRCGDLMTEVEYRGWTRRYAAYCETGVLAVQ